MTARVAGRETNNDYRRQPSNDRRDDLVSNWTQEPCDRLANGRGGTHTSEHKAASNHSMLRPCFGIGHNLSLICQMTSEDIKHQLIIIYAQNERRGKDSKIHPAKRRNKGVPVPIGKGCPGRAQRPPRVTGTGGTASL